MNDRRGTGILVEVDTEELRRTADATDDVIADFREEPVRKFQLAPEETGHEELTRALRDFHRNSARADAEVSAETTELAERLRAAAHEYERIDDETRRTLLEPGGRN